MNPPRPAPAPLALLASVLRLTRRQVDDAGDDAFAIIPADLGEEVALISVGLAPGLGAEVVYFVPKAALPTAFSEIEPVVAALGRRSPLVTLGRPFQRGGARYALHPMLLSPMHLDRSSFILELVRGLGLMPPVLIELTCEGSQGQPSAPHMLRYNKAELLSCQSADELSQLTTTLGAGAKRLVDRIGTELLDQVEELLAQVDDDEADEDEGDREQPHASFNVPMTPVVRDDIRSTYRQPTPIVLPDFGPVSMAVSEGSLELAFNAGGEDDARVVQFTFRLGGDTVVAQCVALLLWGMSDSVIHLALQTEHTADWLSTLFDPSGDDYTSVARKLWRTRDGIEAIAAIEGIWMAPAVQSQELLGAVVEHVAWTLHGLTDGHRLGITARAAGLDDDMIPTQLSDKQLAWYAAAFESRLGAVRGGRVNHGVWANGAQHYCDNHPPVYILPRMSRVRRSD